MEQALRQPFSGMDGSVTRTREAETGEFGFQNENLKFYRRIRSFSSMRLRCWIPGGNCCKRFIWCVALGLFIDDVIGWCVATGRNLAK